MLTHYLSLHQLIVHISHTPLFIVELPKMWLESHLKLYTSLPPPPAFKWRLQNVLKFFSLYHQHEKNSKFTH